MSSEINLSGKTFYQEFVENEYGSMVGKTIVAVRPLTNDEMDEFMWDGDASEIAFVVFLSDGSYFVPMRDEEGNGPGVLMRGEKTACQVLLG